jgi:hypothetical protein
LETLSFFVSELLYIYSEWLIILVLAHVFVILVTVRGGDFPSQFFFPHHPPLSSLTTSKKKVAKMEMRLRAEGVDVDMAFGPPYPKR